MLQVQIIARAVEERQILQPAKQGFSEFEDGGYFLWTERCVCGAQAQDVCHSQNDTVREFQPDDLRLVRCVDTAFSVPTEKDGVSGADLEFMAVELDVQFSVDEKKNDVGSVRLHCRRFVSAQQETFEVNRIRRIFIAAYGTPDGTFSPFVKIL